MLQGTEQIVVDPFDPKKHTTLSSVNFSNGQQNGSSGTQLTPSRSISSTPDSDRLTHSELESCCLEGNCKENFCSSKYFICDLK